MRLGRRLSAGIAEDPPDTPEVPVDEVAPIRADQVRADQVRAEPREPAEQLVDR
ncbi:hypothetical protein GCM10023199_38140 [Actinomycetospora chibensis]|jgi:hypothetical protein